MNDDPDDHDPATDTNVDIDASSAGEPPTLTVTGITLTGAALAAAANAGLLPADGEPSTLEARLMMPADSEPSTIEPMLSVRVLAGTAVVAGRSPSIADEETGPVEIRPTADEDDEERTTLNIESRLMGAFEEASDPPPIKHLPSTSTAPKRKVSKSPTMKGMGMPLPPIPAPPPKVERQQAPSEPTLDDERNDETIDRPPPSKAAKEAHAAPEVLESIGGDDGDEQTSTSTRKQLVAAAEETEEREEPEEVDDADTSIDAGLLSGGLSLSAVAAAASALDAGGDEDDGDGEGDDEIPTSVRLEVAPLTALSSSDLVTDAGPPPIPGPAQSAGGGESERERTLAMANLPTAPAPFPISAHVRVEGPRLEPLEPRGPKGSVKVVADGTGSTPIAYSDLPGRWAPLPSLAAPATLARRPHRRGRAVVLMALLACIGTFVVLRRVQNKTALVDPAASLAARAASSDLPPTPGASASVASAATADPNDDVGPPTAAAAAPATGTAAAPSAPEPAKARVAAPPPHKPPPLPVWRPSSKPAAPPPAPAPKASAWKPMHI